MTTYRFALAALFAAALLLGARPAAAQGGISFSFDNLEVASQAVTFDVLAKAENAGTRLGDTQVYLDYNAAFGTDAAAGERVSATLGEALAGAGAYGAPIINDNRDSRVSLTAEFLGAADEGFSLSEDAVVLLHVTLQAVSGDETGRISFYEPLMEGQQYTSDLSQAFTGVDVDAGLLELDLTGILGPLLQASTAGAGAVQLEWTSESGRFEVEHAESTGDSFRPVARVDTPVKDGRFAHRVDGLEIGTHRFRVRRTDETGSVTYSEAVEVTVEMAEAFLLDPVYPNPFNPQANIRFAVKEAEPVRIEVYNALGQRVRVLYDGTPTAGTYQKVTIDGSGLAGGLYIVRMQGESFSATRRVMLVK